MILILMARHLVIIIQTNRIMHLFIICRCGIQNDYYNHASKYTSRSRNIFKHIKPKLCESQITALPKTATVNRACNVTIIMRGLVMGRFQPFHLGHLALARQVLDECDGLIVAITSAQFNYTEKDPFTAGERIEMIHGALAESGADMSACITTAIENQFNIATWGGYLRASLPEFGQVYSGNRYVSMLLSDLGVDVIEPKFFDRGIYNATLIRRMIASGGSWKSMVPHAVRVILERIDAPRRLATISESDTRPMEH